MFRISYLYYFTLTESNYSKIFNGGESSFCYLKLNRLILGLVYHCFVIDCKTSNYCSYVNHTRICLWNIPVLSNEGKLSGSRKQLEPMKGSNSRLTNYSQMRYPLRHAAVYSGLECFCWRWSLVWNVEFQGF